MPPVYEVLDPSQKKDRRLRTLRLVEISDHIIRKNRRENTQLDLRLRQIKQQQNIIQRNFQQNSNIQRLHYKKLCQTFNYPTDEISRESRMESVLSYYTIKTQRNQSAPPNLNRPKNETKLYSRINTTSTNVRPNQRAMTAFQGMSYKPSCRTLNNLLILLDDKNDSDKKA